ncbi:peptidase S8/S53 domain-containing protein [Cercophora scortea]|uniref:Peptidase S8/S53 domain-containing protein n=1 Tax=Cercophora scortea TaxID=314031 RepID=A0AAE0IA97_9PEZI|nr:peptidase S8/S53 domain-containing protein [Cercophora scortea]
MMHHVFITCFGLFCLVWSRAVPPGHVVHEMRLSSHPQLSKRMHPDVLLPVRIGLKHSKDALENAERWLMEVSHPHSPKYGQFWSQETVIDVFRPSDEAVEAVGRWLTSSGIAKHRITHSDNRGWFAFDATVQEVEFLLHTEYLHDGQRRASVGCNQYHVPAHIQQHIDYITPGKNSNDELASCDEVITPACVRALYNFDAADPTAPVNPDNSLGIFEEGDFYTQEDLDLFFSNHTSYIPNGTHPILNSIDGGHAPNNWTDFPGSESELDFALAYPIVYPQSITLFQTDDMYYAQRDASKSGWFNTFFDAIDGSYCTYSAWGETGNDPGLDPIYPDLRNGTASDEDIYNGPLMCGVYKPTNVISISYGVYEMDLPAYYQKRQCDELLKLALQGVSVVQASGDTGVGAGGYEDCLGDNDVFTPTALNSCPWITNVGGTTVVKGNTVYDPEVAVNNPWQDYSSSGGFSNIFPIPAYQASAISHYFKHHNPPYPYYHNGNWNQTKGIYNRNGRGIPDVSANGDKIAVYWSGAPSLSGGTSASCPIFASLLNRIVEERLKVGKGPIGFVNPVLYMYPGVLNDITNGSNPGCGTEGFRAVEGWDPVTGLGTPDFGRMLGLFLSLP